jgi:hypothetical protein
MFSSRRPLVSAIVVTAQALVLTVYAATMLRDRWVLFMFRIAFIGGVLIVVMYLARMAQNEM